MSDPSDDTAARLVAARRAGGCVALASTSAPASVEDAYRVQDAVLDAIASGRRVGAWKVSPPNPAYGITASPIPPPCLHAAPAALRAPSAGLLGVEVEIAFRVGRDLSSDAADLTDDAIHAAFDAALVAIELCATRLDDWPHASALWRLADFQSNEALVLGTGIAAWPEFDFAGAVAQLHVNGVLRTEAKGSHPAGNPAKLLPWLARHAAQRGEGLASGDIVTTGSWIGLVPIAPGDRIDARFPLIGEAALQLVT